jgi:hypothetical protein
MRRRIALVCAVLAFSTAAQAEDDALLIQLQTGGAYRVWHTEGLTQLGDDDAMLLDAIATPEGSETTMTAIGPAQSRRTASGVVISLLHSGPDNELLVDRDGCGHIKLWHGDGATQLTEDQLTELVLAAVPGGGKRIVLDDRRIAKSFLNSLGVMVAIWRPVKRAR